MSSGKLTIKRCSKCRESKSIKEFNRVRMSPDGFGYWCRSCANADSARMRQKYSIEHDEAYYQRVLGEAAA